MLIKFLDEILSLIEKRLIIYISQNIGESVLTESEKKIVEKLNPIHKVTPFEQSYIIGKLSSIIGDKNLSEVRYNDFKDYLKKEEYKLTPNEKRMLDIAKKRTYYHLKKLGETMKETVGGIVLSEDKKLLEFRQKAIKEEIESGILKKKSISNIVSEIGHRTENWERDLGRIVATENNNIYQEAKAAYFSELSHTDNPQVYKKVYDGACKFCIKLFLTGGIGSRPIVFNLSELQANGTNVGVKQAQWKPVVGSVHPWCRCDTRIYIKGQVWNEETSSFEYPKKYESKYEPKLKVTVGEKIFYV